MKKKALIIGASPSVFAGPWVRIDDHEAWRIVREGDYNGAVEVEVDGGVRRFYDGIIEHGVLARAVIRGKIPNVPHVSVWLEAVNGSI